MNASIKLSQHIEKVSLFDSCQTSIVVELSHYVHYIECLKKEVDQYSCIIAQFSDIC